jgi:hypothetical protein
MAKSEKPNWKDFLGLDVPKRKRNRSPLAEEKRAVENSAEVRDVGLDRRDVSHDQSPCI